MNVLITGSTSSQSSRTTFSRGDTFAGIISENLSLMGVNVELSRPYLEWDKDYLKKFDAILVGISPLTSLSANSLYPALAVASRAEKLKKLSLFFDAPEPQKIHASLVSMSKGNVDLFKTFYENRREYAKVSEDPRIMREIEVFCQRLLMTDWPTTLYPWTPWTPLSQVEKRLPNISNGLLYGVSIDSYLLEDCSVEDTQEDRESPYWTYDNNKTKWFKATEKSFSYRTVPAKEGRFVGREEVSSVISKSVGSLVTTYRSEEFWWSPLLSSSLKLKVPVVSDWRITKSAGDSWNYLPASLEELEERDRKEISEAQLSSYVEMLDFKEDVSSMVLSAITK